MSDLMNKANTPPELKRKCKQTGCNKWFRVSRRSLQEDKLLGLSDPEYCPEHSRMHAKSYSRIAVHHIDIQETEFGEKLIRQIEEAKAKGEKLLPGPGGIGFLYRELRPFEMSPNNEYTEQEFPIAEKDEEILATLEDHQVIVLVGPTGSGKSTHVPHLLLNSKWSRRGPIVVTQPRIQATQQIPEFVAKLNNSNYGPGCDIGYSHSKDNAYDRRTRLLFMTDGKLINDIVSGAVANYSIIMIDEAHERSVNIDLILALLRDQLYLYPHLRLIIASATIDENSFINFFGGPDKVPLVKSKGFTYGYDSHWWGDQKEDWWKNVNGGVQPERDVLPNAIADLVVYLCKNEAEAKAKLAKENDGHILVFLPGTREIDTTVSAINARSLPGVVCLPLYATRPFDEQESALNPKKEKHPKIFGKRRVVVSTNVAETSLTVKGVKYVIDSGYIKESYWNSKSEIVELRTVRHSKDGCMQRWGRAGRTARGDVYMLYTEQQYKELFLPHTSPNIVRASMEQVILTALAAGVRDINNFQWMPLPEAEDQEVFHAEFTRALFALAEKNAIEIDKDEIAYLKPFGLELRGVPSSMDIAAVFTEGDLNALGVEVATLLPFLKLEFGLQSILDWNREWNTYRKLEIRKRHIELIAGCRDDLDVYLKLWSIWEMLATEQKQDEWCQRYGINQKSFKDGIVEQRKKLLGTVMDWRKAENRPIIFEKMDALRALIAWRMQKDIYIPLEDEQVDMGFGYINSESYFDEGDYYEEYEEGFEIDTSPISQPKTKKRTEVFCRLSTSTSSRREEDLIELAPISICYDQDDLQMFVACQRRANFMRPARANILGMNIVRLDPTWLPTIKNGSWIDRALLYASLSRRREPLYHERYRRRLFIPWIIPLDYEFDCSLQSWIPGKGGSTILYYEPQNAELLQEKTAATISVPGWISDSDVDPLLRANLKHGATIRARVIDFELSEGGEIRLRLGLLRPQEQAFEDFVNHYHPGSAIDVVMRRVIKDPLERRPIFTVLEPKTGLEIPMSESDFCGDTHFRSYFGTRFEIGETFRVDVDAILKDSQEVYLSRVRYLLAEYEQIPENWHLTIQKDIRVVRNEADGVYLAIQKGGAPYITFTRRALLPSGLRIQTGEFVRARLRRHERNIKPDKLRESINQGEPLPKELDLGVEADLRIPPAFDKFQQLHPIGDLLTVTVDRPLDSGGLLVDLGDGLKGMIYESELGLKDNGKLKASRDYHPGERILVRVTSMKDIIARVELSIFRTKVLPLEIKEGDVFEAEVLLVRGNPNQPDVKYITASLNKEFRLDIRSLDPDLQLDIGDSVTIRIDHKNDRTQYLRAALVD